MNNDNSNSRSNVTFPLIEQCIEQAICIFVRLLCQRGDEEESVIDKSFFLSASTSVTRPVPSFDREKEIESDSLLELRRIVTELFDMIKQAY